MSFSPPESFWGAEQVDRSDVHREAMIDAVNGTLGSVKSKSDHVTHTCSPSPVSPTEIHSLSRKWPAALVATSVRVGQQLGSEWNGSCDVSHVASDSSVASSDRYTPTPFVPGVDGSNTLKFRSPANRSQPASTRFTGSPLEASPPMAGSSPSLARFAPLSTDRCQPVKLNTSFSSPR